MKKLFLVLVCTFLCFSVFSQEKVLKFKGMPIDGNVYDMRRHIESRGHTYDCKFDNAYFFDAGKFAGYNVDFIILNYNPQQLVESVEIHIDITNFSESSISTLSSHLCDLYNKNYGILDYRYSYFSQKNDYISKHNGDLNGFEYKVFEYIPNTDFCVSVRIIKQKEFNTKLFVIMLVNYKNYETTSNDI